MLLLERVCDLVDISFVLNAAHDECSLVLIQAAEVKKQICDVALSKRYLGV